MFSLLFAFHHMKLLQLCAYSKYGYTDQLPHLPAYLMHTKVLRNPKDVQLSEMLKSSQDMCVSTLQWKCELCVKNLVIDGGGGGITV